MERNAQQGVWGGQAFLRLCAYTKLLESPFLKYMWRKIFHGRAYIKENKYYFIEKYNALYFIEKYNALRLFVYTKCCNQLFWSICEGKFFMIELIQRKIKYYFTEKYNAIYFIEKYNTLIYPDFIGKTKSKIFVRKDVRRDRVKIFVLFGK